MESSANQVVSIITLRQIFCKVYAENREYVTQQQAAAICSVDVQTIRHWQKSGDLSHSIAVDRLVHYQQVSLDELLSCFYKKKYEYDPESPYMIKLRSFYTKKCSDYPDGLLIKDVVAITGYVKTTVVNWMNKGRLKGYNRGKIYRIPKKSLIDFFCGSYYRQIIRKSKEQKADMQSFLEEYNNFQEVFACQNTSLNSSKSWSIHDAVYTGNL